jgi:hypothetical protein
MTARAMQPGFSRQSVWPWAAALLALAVPGVVAPSASRAGCVHDGVQRQGHFDGAAFFEHLIDAGAMLAPDGAEQHAPRPPKPCSGTSCSRSQGLPAPPPAVITALGAGTWGCLAVDDQPARPGAHPWREDAPRDRPRHEGLSVFHPPRRHSA